MRRFAALKNVSSTAVVVGLLVGTAMAETVDQAKARMKREKERLNQSVNSQLASGKKLAAPKKPAAPAFDPKAAPAPEKSVEAFVRAARSATSMTSLLEFLPPEERKALEAMQKRYNPKDAAKRRAELAKNKKLSPETVEHLTSAPYDTRLKFLKRIATKVLKITSATVDGNKAKVKVDIEITDVINGVRYNRSTAMVGLVGIGNRWYFSTFDENNVATRE